MEFGKVFEVEKQKLIEELKISGITHQAVLDAFKSIPREMFVLPTDIDYAYQNTALPIQCNQTISQPYIIALMTQALAETSPKKVLELGTGSGYQAAILAKIFDEVYTIERIETLHKIAVERFAALNLDNIHAVYADGYEGWQNQAPFDGIIITAAPPEIPQNLLEQLSPNGGRMVIPVGEDYAQTLKTIDRHDDNFTESTIESVRFVPLVPGTKK